MAIDANKRVLNWNAKLNMERAQHVLDRMQPVQSARGPLDRRQD